MDFEQAVKARFEHRGGLAGALQTEAERDLLAELGAALAYHRAQNLIEQGAAALAMAEQRVKDRAEMAQAQTAALDGIEKRLRDARVELARWEDDKSVEGTHAWHRADELRQSVEHERNEAKAILGDRRRAVEAAQRQVSEIADTLALLRRIEAPALELWPMVLASS